MTGWLRTWRVTIRGYSFGPGRWTWQDKHEQHIASRLKTADRVPAGGDLSKIRARLERRP